MSTGIKTEIELKVGMFVAIGIALVMLAILVLGGANTLFTSNSHYIVRVPAAEGLIPGAKVLLGGINVGTVQSLDINSKRKDIEIQLLVNQKYSSLVREDSQAEIATQGLLGDKYISISMGTDTAEPIPQQGVIPTRPSKDLTQILGQSDQLMISLNRIAGNLDQILTSFNSGNRSEALFSGLTATARNLSQITRRLDQELESVNLAKIGKSLNSILEKIDRGQGTIGGLINDPALYDDLKSLTGGANRSRIVRNLVRKSIREEEEAEAEANRKP